MGLGTGLLPVRAHAARPSGQSFANRARVDRINARNLDTGLLRWHREGMTDIDPAEENKRRFLDAFGRFAAGEIEVLREIIREDFVSHTVGAPPGRDAWIEFILDSPIATAEIEIQHVIADDEFVVAHYRLIPAEGLNEDVVDIWRFEDGLIVEHWDVSRPITG